MGIWDALSDLAEAVVPWTIVEAEAPAEEPKEEPAETESKDDETPAEEAEAEEAAEEEEEEEEEEERRRRRRRLSTPKRLSKKPDIYTECKQSAQCAPMKHHFDECVERVHQQESEGEAKEDCVEEFFHLAHCASACAAPKLWAKLK